MNIYRLLITVCLLAVCTGCAKLETNVSVLRPGYLAEFKKEDSIKLGFALSQSESTWADARDRANEKIAEYYAGRICSNTKCCLSDGSSQLNNITSQNCYNKIKTELLARINENKVEKNNLDSLADQCTKDCPNTRRLPRYLESKKTTMEKLGRSIRDKSERIIEYNKKVHLRFNQLPESDRKEMLAGQKPIDTILIVLLDRYTTMTDEFKLSIESEIAESSPGSSTRDESVKQIRNAIEPISNESFSCYGPRASGLGDDPMAYYVAAAKKNDWEPGYNYVLVEGQFGNTDIAVILNEEGNYSIKSLAFDPSQTASFVSKAVSQMVVMGARIAGVPLSVPSAASKKNDGYQLAVQSGGLTDKLTTAREQQAKMKTYRQTVKLLAKAIVAQEKAFEDDKSDAQLKRLKTAMEAIQAAINSHKGRLQISD